VDAVAGVVLYEELRPEHSPDRRRHGRAC
jgi:hypothetical protein